MSSSPATRRLLEGDSFSSTLRKLAMDIIAEGRKSNSAQHPLGLIGLPSRGNTLALRLAGLIQEESGLQVPVGQIDITFHRDDLDRNLPMPQRTDIPFDTTGRTLILVDDVLFSGRTVRAALCALMDFGRPAAIRLLAFVERGHRQLPIQADLVGLRAETSPNQNVLVKLVETDGVDAVELVEPVIP